MPRSRATRAINLPAEGRPLVDRATQARDVCVGVAAARSALFSHFWTRTTYSKKGKPNFPSSPVSPAPGELLRTRREAALQGSGLSQVTQGPRLPREGRTRCSPLPVTLLRDRCSAPRPGRRVVATSASRPPRPAGSRPRHESGTRSVTQDALGNVSV